MPMRALSWSGAVAAAAIALFAAAAEAPTAATGYARVPGGRFESVLPVAPKLYAVELPAYELAVTPVTNQQFLAFVSTHPEWRRGAAPQVFADDRYLERWQGPLSLGAAVDPDSAVTGVSWFAARAYCAAEGARLPRWHEWEYAAAADATRADARSDPAWRQRMLDWYATLGGRPLPPVGRDPANLYGVHDLAAGVWEWVDDYNALMVSSDNREQGDPDLMKFCGAGALTMRDREAYAVLMRIAMLSSLEARYTTRDLGFRCARDLASPSARSIGIRSSPR
jgi:formylglycine-generating enzyme required for sulfatase activity